MTRFAVRVDVALAMLVVFVCAIVDHLALTFTGAVLVSVLTTARWAQLKSPNTMLSRFPFQLMFIIAVWLFAGLAGSFASAAFPLGDAARTGLALGLAALTAYAGAVGLSAYVRRFAHRLA